MIEELKFYSLLSDTTFKYLFKNNNTRPILEKMIYKITGINLEGYKLIDNELNTGNFIKDYRLDLLFEKDNELVIIEMNQEVNQSIYNKNHSYLYRLAGNLYKQGGKYEETKYVTQINFNNCKCPVEDDIGILIYEFLNQEYNLKIEGIKTYEIYLAKYKDICYNQDERKRYLSLFKAESYEELRKIAGDNKEVLKLVDEIEKLNEEKYFGALYDAEEEHKRLVRSSEMIGEERGMIKGAEAKSKEIARSMLNKNMDINLVSELTGLSIEEINDLIIK